MSIPTKKDRWIPWIAVAAEAGIGLFALLLGLALTRPPLSQITWTADAIVWAVAWGFVGSLPLVIGLVLARRASSPALQELFDSVEDWVAREFGHCSWFQLSAIALAAGFGEEFLFRGVVQEAITHRFDAPLLGLAAASLLFGLAHAVTRTYAIFAGLVGVYLGVLWLATENLLVPTVTHAAYDLFALLYFLRRGRARSEEPRSKDPRSEELESG